MSGILGWVRLPDSGDARTLDAMIARASRVDSSRFESAAAPGHALAAGGLGRTSGLFHRHGRIAALQGHPYWDQSGRRYTQLQEVAERLLDAFAERGVAALASLHGDYAVAIL